MMLYPLMEAVRSGGDLENLGGDSKYTKTIVFQREINPLLSIRDAYPKTLLAQIRHDPMQYEGIQIIDLAQWLINDAVSQI